MPNRPAHERVPAWLATYVQERRARGVPWKVIARDIAALGYTCDRTTLWRMQHRAAGQAYESHGKQAA